MGQTDGLNSIYGDIHPEKRAARSFRRLLQRLRLSIKLVSN